MRLTFHFHTFVTADYNRAMKKNRLVIEADFIFRNDWNEWLYLVSSYYSYEIIQHRSPFHFYSSSVPTVTKQGSCIRSYTEYK